MIRSENSRMLFWKETYMGQGSFRENKKEVAASTTHSQFISQLALVPSHHSFLRCLCILFLCLCNTHSFLLFACVHPFFACAKKGTKKAQPISMRQLSLAEYFPAEIGGGKLNSLEHFE